jgi:hypothetical protein
MPVETTVIVVKKGDTLWNIVKAHGFPPADYEKIYRAPYNKAFRAKRPDPGLIFAGDRLYLPKFTPAEFRERARRVKDARKALEGLDGPIGRLRKQIAEVRRAGKADAADFGRLLKEFDARVAELEKKATTYERLADEAISAGCQTGNPYACAGSGGTHRALIAKRDRTRRFKETLEKQVRALKKAADAKSDAGRKALAAMETTLEAMMTLRDGMARDLCALASSMEAAAKDPY